MKFFITHHPPSGLKALEAAQALIAQYEKLNKRLESENLRLIGLAYPLTSSPKNEVTPMNYDDERRAIELSDAAGRANNNGLHGLADKLTAEAEKLLSDGQGQSFQDFGASRGLNMEKLLPSGCTTNGEHQHFASKHTQELFDCWLAARGQKVWTPPTEK